MDFKLAYSLNPRQAKQFGKVVSRYSAKRKFNIVLEKTILVVIFAVISALWISYLIDTAKWFDSKPEYDNPDKTTVTFVEAILLIFNILNILIIFTSESVKPIFRVLMIAVYVIFIFTNITLLSYLLQSPENFNPNDPRISVGSGAYWVRTILSSSKLLYELAMHFAFIYFVYS